MMYETGKSLEEVKTYAGRVDTQVESIYDDVLRFAKKRWGEDGFAATITSSQREKFLRDKSTWEGFKKWRSLWKTKKEDVDSSWYGSDDRYAEVEKFDIEGKAWRAKFNELGYYLGAPTTVEVSQKDGKEVLSHPDVPLGQTPIDWSKVLLATTVIGVAGFGSYMFFKKRKENRALYGKS